MCCGDIVFRAFDPVKVRLSLDSTNIQHEKLVFQLVEPFIEGFSVKTLKEELAEAAEIEASKRKSMDDVQTTKASKKNKKKKK